MINNKAVASLLLIVSIGATALIMAISSLNLGLGELDLGFFDQKNGEVLSLVSACLENTLWRLKLNNNYNGGILNFQPGSCIIKIDDSIEPNVKFIRILAGIDDYSHISRFKAKVIGEEIELEEWQE